MRRFQTRLSFYASVHSSCAAFARLGGASANLARPGGWALAIPGGTSVKVVHVFKDIVS